MRQFVFLFIFIVAVLLTGFFLYQYLAGGGEVARPDVESIVAVQLGEYRKIKNLNLDLRIFSDPFFRSLFSPVQAFGAGILEPVAPPGRKNPFVPF